MSGGEPTNRTRFSGGAVSLTHLKRTVRLGVKSILLHSLRSFLTVLGMVFGVSSVIAMLAVGEGASHEAQEQLRQLGSTNIILHSKLPTEDQSSTTSSPWTALEYGITYRDLKEIKAVLPKVRIIVPARIINKTLWNISHSIDARVLATVPWYPKMRNYRIVAGRYFSDLEMESLANVCVLGADTARALFPIDDPLGKNVKVGSDYYRVIGVLSPPSKTKNPNQNSAVDAAGPRMYVPITTAKDRFGETIVERSSGSMKTEKIELHEATIQVQDKNDVVATGAVVEQILNRNHKQNDYEIIIPLDLLRQAEASARMFNIVLGTIAGISLLVGGIGIMNIMLASVTERTREIGIRRALGAKKQDIIMQFLVEAVILSAAGGLLGVVLGVTIPWFITFFSSMETIVTLWAPALAFSISGLVGILFGIYPAMRAADMDPVEALRHE